MRAESRMVKNSGIVILPIVSNHVETTMHLSEKRLTGMKIWIQIENIKEGKEWVGFMSLMKRQH